MLRVTKWLQHDPFRLKIDYLDDISCLEQIGNVILKYDDDLDDDDDEDDEDSDDDDDYYGWGFDREDDDDDFDDIDDDDEDDTEDYDLEDIILNSDRWIVCEDDYYGETGNETEDAEVIN